MPHANASRIDKCNHVKAVGCVIDNIYRSGIFYLYFSNNSATFLIVMSFGYEHFSEIKRDVCSKD